MRTKVVYYIIIFFLQVVLFNHLELSRFLFPQVFIVLLIAMPIYWHKALQVGLGFLLGLAMDFFVATPGLHASACLWLVVIRLVLLSYVDLKNLILDKSVFSAATAGNALFFRTMVGLVLFYHIYVFFFENIGHINWPNLGLTVFASSVFAILVISLFQLIFFKSSGVKA